MKDESLENTIITLHGQGWSIRKLSKELGVSRERIRRVVVANQALRTTTPDQAKKPQKKRVSKLYPYKEFICELLEKYSNITGQRVYEHICERGFEGEITIVRDYLNSIRKVAVKTPVRMVETLPGQRAAHDWSDYQVPLTGSGKIEQVTFFSYILSYSRRQYIEVVEDKKQKTLLQVLINAFIYLDGVPREIKSDNQKACVDRWEAGRPVFNVKYLEFATHYLFRPLTIRPGKPTENLKVERPFYYLERSFLNGREFRDIIDLKEQLQQWLESVNDLRKHGTTKKRPIDMYTQEHSHLQVVPANHFDTSRVVHLVVNQESCVQWKGYQYVVPQQYMYEVCPVRITDEHLVVYSSGGETLAKHPLAEKNRKERYVGVVQKTSGKPDLVMADVITRLESFSPEMNEYIQQVKRHKPGSWRHHLRSLLAMRVNYRVEDIMVAIRRALKYKVFDSGTIEGFLVNNSEPRYSIKLSFKPKNNNYEQ
ncbi:MAG: IS21 family transposase [Bacteroidales bacterium]|nr:IS21 family transposase [Bacteroidales bacterium]